MTNLLKRGTKIRTTYQYSQAGRIVRYKPIPRYYEPEIVEEWYIVKFEGNKKSTWCCHRSMMVVT